MKNLMKKIRKSNKGFTLVELIIVIAIIAVLTAVAAPQYIKYVDKSRWSKDQNEAATLLTSVQSACVDVNSDTDSTNDIKSVTIKFSKTGIDTVVDSNVDKELKTTLGSSYRTAMKVTNAGNATGAQAVYTIVVDAAGVATGSWGAS